jgi:hypothetical protein
VTDEQWRPIPGWPAYEASDLGRVRSVDRSVAYSDGRVRHWPGRILTTTVDSRSGRNQVVLARAGRKRTYRVYKLVMAAFVGPCPPGMQVCHGDGDCTNDALFNLRYGTNGSNQRDAVRHGTHRNSKKTQCKNGHPFTESNVYVPPGRPNSRVCVACNRAQGVRRYAATRRPPSEP